MPKDVTTDAIHPSFCNPRLSAKLLRGQRSADDVWQDRESFDEVLGLALSRLKAEGFSTFKSGSCFADLVATRTQNQSRYNSEYFANDAAIVIPK